MISGYSFEFREQHLTLLPQRALYWKEEQSLLLADMHLGKAAHFRKSGIGVPGVTYGTDLEKLTLILHHYPVKKLLILGDFFHSDHNGEFDAFRQWSSQFDDIEVHLIKGNHDILSNEHYLNAGFRLHYDSLQLGPFNLTHHPTESLGDESLYNLCGHIHPSVRLTGRGRQAMNLPCFYFGQRQGILPAFGHFTGTARIQPASTTDNIFVVLDETVVKVNPN